MGVEVRSFRKFEKNSLRGFLVIYMTNIGLEIRDATVHEKDGKRWIGLPAKPYQDESGNTKYSHIIKFTDKAKWSLFQDLALKALDKYRIEKGDQPSDDTPF